MDVTISVAGIVPTGRLVFWAQVNKGRQTLTLRRKQKKNSRITFLIKSSFDYFPRFSFSFNG